MGNYGRKGFYVFQGRCDTLAARLLRDQPTQQEWLRWCNDLDLHGATRTAIRQVYAYLRGVEQCAFMSHIVWRHEVNGVLVDRGDPSIDYTTLDISKSRFVWADSNKPW